MNSSDFSLILVRLIGLVLFIAGAIHLSFSLIVYPAFLFGGDAVLSPQLIVYASDGLITGPLGIFFSFVIFGFSKRIASFICKYCKND